MIPPPGIRNSEPPADLELTAIERIVAAHKKTNEDKLRAAVVAAARKSKVEPNVTVEMSKQVRLPGEPRSIHAIVTGTIKVVVMDGIITQRFGHGKLNSVPRAQQDAFEKVIPRVPMMNGKILRLISSEALQALYRRGSGQSAQERGRKSATTALPAAPKTPTLLPTPNKDTYYGERG